LLELDMLLHLARLHCIFRPRPGRLRTQELTPSQPYRRAPREYNAGVGRN